MEAKISRPAPERAGVSASRAGYLGPQGTFTEEALLTSARPGAVEAVPFESIYESVVGLVGGEVDYALAPIENSLDGSVTVTLDLLAEEAAKIQIVGEALLSVRHFLIGPAQVELEEVQRVMSHPQVPGQCSKFLRTELGHVEISPASSTAEAVRQVCVAGDPSQVALGTRLAAEIYGGVVLRESVQDRDDNETRFVWLARNGEGEPPPLVGGTDGGSRKTSMVFWGPGADHAGWLVGCLDEFARRDINLTKIESRPRRERMGHYMFFVDLEGDRGDDGVVAAVGGLESHCEEVRALGSYGAAANPPLHSPARDG